MPEIAQRRGMGGDRVLIELDAEGDQHVSVDDLERRGIPELS